MLFIVVAAVCVTLGLCLVLDVVCLVCGWLVHDEVVGSMWGLQGLVGGRSSPSFRGMLGSLEGK